MPTTEEIVATAVQDATGGEGGDEGSSEVASSSDTGEQVASSDEKAQVVADTTEPAKEPTIVTEPDELTKELEALGIKAPKEGERENRLPYSRVKKITENLKKKLEAAHTAALAERDGKLTSTEQELSNFRKADELFRSDPDRYVQVLAALNPAYRKYVDLKPAVEAKPAAVVAAEALGPRPAPDWKFEDGSLGYSPAQHEKLLDWVAATAEAKAVARAEESYTKRFGPIEKAWQANEAAQQGRTKVTGQFRQAQKIWGKLFDEDYALGEKSEVLKAMRENDGEQGRPFLSFDACVASVLAPKQQAWGAASRDALRAEWTKELNERPAAAARTGPAATKTDEASAPQTAEDIVRAAVVAAGLK